MLNKKYSNFNFLIQFKNKIKRVQALQIPTIESDSLQIKSTQLQLLPLHRKTHTRVVESCYTVTGHFIEQTC